MTFLGGAHRFEYGKDVFGDWGQADGEKKVMLRCEALFLCSMTGEVDLVRAGQKGKG